MEAPVMISEFRRQHSWLVILACCGWLVPSTLSLTSPIAAPIVSPSVVFIGGLGYCGGRIARSIREAYPDCIIVGSVRSKERRAELLSNQGEGRDLAYNDVYVLDLDDEYTGLNNAGQASLASATHIIQTVAPIADHNQDPLLALHGDLLRQRKGVNPLCWVGYLSSTGVYGDHHGAWVTEDESSELRCVDAKSLARIEAEWQWRQLEKASGQGIRVDCFRCGGIYGPGRGPLFSTVNDLRLSSDSSLLDQTPKYVNRILVDDIAGAMLAAMSSDRPLHNGRVYNLVDDNPAPRRDVILEARKLRGLVDGSDANDNGAAATFTGRSRPPTRSTGNKRCCNQRLKDEYGWKLTAPTYKEGLAFLYEQEYVFRGSA
jgi:nucleoside-diphosphate-sugar epimerase